MLREIIKNWQLREKWWLILISVVLIILTTIPYFYLYANTPTGYIYDWATYINPGDNFVYYSYINQASEGNWLLDNLYTGEVTVATLRPFWLILGKTAALFNFSAPFIFHAFRLLLIPALVFFSYLFISYFIKSIKQRLLASALFLLAAGQGWLYILLNPYFWLNNKWANVPFDFFMADAFPFSAMLTSPHFTASWSIFLIVIFFGWLSLQYKQVSYAITAGLAGWFLLLFQPFFIPTIFVLLCGWWIYRTIVKKTICWYGTFNLSLIVLLVSPAIIYYFYLYFFDWVTVVKTAQNYLLSPKLGVSAVSFGLLWLLSMFGVYWWRQQSSLGKRLDNIKFLAGWAILGWVLIYLPFLWQRRLAVGWHFPLIILSSFFFIIINSKLASKYRNWDIKKYFLWVPVAVILVLSNFNILANNFFYYARGNYSLYYYPQELGVVTDWLNANSRSSDLMLSNDEITLMALPGLVNRKVFVGHLVETVYADSKIGRLSWFFGSNDQDDKKVDFLKSRSIDYLIFDDEAEIFGKEFEPKGKRYLLEVYEVGRYNIYKVNLE